ncbi:MAG: choice-of-anchor A family protein [Phenylobacterium sp.]|uniref:collagen-binding domain-containing protein n=1 Tax=Phenylobacterium sp. TaxID=1871053 RepID=UPI001220DFF9|nr:collagen-binding domain-containing protein [Phenylobacterium sp.]TAJ68562.1 MAG: choice-of-anchor A family protein [Phenylobacterium sp.]
MKLYRPLSVIAASLVLVVATPAAAAQVLTPSQDAASINAALAAMQTYNLITLGDLKSNQTVEGRAFVGGDLSGGSSNYFTNPKGQTGTALTVVGDVTDGPKNVGNGGGVKVGGNLDSGVNASGRIEVDGNGKNINGGAQVYIDGDAKNVNGQNVYIGGGKSGYVNGKVTLGDHTVAGLQTTLQAQRDGYVDSFGDLSAYLAGLTATSAMTYSADGQAAIFNAGAGTGVAVFNLSNLDQLFKNRSRLEFADPATYDTVIVNVAGANISLGNTINFQAAEGLGTKVIWNFYQAETLDFGSKVFYGSVLAPNADAKIGNFIQGTAVFDTLDQKGVIKMGTYGGGLTVEAPKGLAAIVTPVPEPSTWAMMIVGFGAIGAVLRRRRTAFAH